MAESGAAAVSLDHVTKSAEGRGRYSIGAVHKLNGLDGAAYTLDNRHPFGFGLKGVSTIRIAKDRPGQLRKHALPGSGGMYWFADLILDETSVEGRADSAQIAAPVARDPEAKPTILMKRISDELVKHPDGLAQRVLCDLVTGKAETIRIALSYLRAGGLLRVSQDDDDGVIRVDDDPIRRTAPLGVLSGAVVGVVTALPSG